MPETIEFMDPHFFGPSEKYTITNAKTGVSVIKDGKEIVDSYGKVQAIERLVRDCIDLDEWKHSWHHSLDYRDKETRQILVEIIAKKITDREKEIEKLRFCLKVMSKEDEE